MALVKP